MCVCVCGCECAPGFAHSLLRHVSQHVIRKHDFLFVSCVPSKTIVSHQGDQRETKHFVPAESLNSLFEEVGRVKPRRSTRNNNNNRPGVCVSFFKKLGRRKVPCRDLKTPIFKIMSFNSLVNIRAPPSFSHPLPPTSKLARIFSTGPIWKKWAFLDPGPRHYAIFIQP